MPAGRTESAYHHTCLNEYPEICRKKYGTIFDFEAIEREVGRLRRNTEFAYDDLHYFEVLGHW